jgi:hypothetical protein
MGKEIDMRESKQNIENTGIYARIRALPIPANDREHAIQALRQAERVADLLVAIKEKLVALRGAFLRPSLNTKG